MARDQPVDLDALYSIEIFFAEIVIPHHARSLGCQNSLEPAGSRESVCLKHLVSHSGFYRGQRER